MHPHEFSGGMRQRAVIAMAIACRPALLIADEPTTALDVTVQAQVLEVLMSIKEEIDSAILLITHDLGVVAGMANKVMVMYAGRAAEVGAVEQLFEDAAHPYTIGLMDSMPSVDAADRELRPIGGQPPSMISPPSGCPFHPRCRLAHLDAWCVEEVPPLVSVGGIGVGGHRAACHYIDEVRAARVAETQ
jgi:oligopeptide/dipeptide ABC transporter ATP-binding protein